MIRHLAHSKIDKQKWDECILSSVNRLIYARSFYLDRMSPGWEGLVMGDYEAVMPLCRRRKWGIAYLFQPAFFQQGGIYYRQRPQEGVIMEFLRQLPVHYRFAEITLNHDNICPAMEGIAFTSRNNYILDLSANYEEIKQGYSGSFIRNLNKAIESGHQYIKEEQKEEAIISLYQQLYSDKQPDIRKSDYLNFLSVCRMMKKERNLILRSALDANGKLLASLLLLRDGNRMYNMMSCLTSEGRKSEGNYFLYDQLIMEFSGTANLYLDLEGSDVPGIAEFYLRMSPEKENYPFIRFNQLPRLVRWLKG